MITRPASSAKRNQQHDLQTPLPHAADGTRPLPVYALCIPEGERRQVPELRQTERGGGQAEKGKMITQYFTFGQNHTHRHLVNRNQSAQEV